MVKNFTAEGFTTNLSKRILEPTEVISGKEGKLYANRKDDRSLNFSMIAYDLKERLNINRTQKILEVCCGAGQLSHFLYEITKDPNIIATDGSKELINSAKKKYSKEPIQFKVQNIHNHFGKEEFDVVICKDSMHHFPNISKGIKELLELVKLEGTLYIYDLTRDCPIKLIEKRCNTFIDIHERKRFLASLNASPNLSEMKKILNNLSVKFKYYYPIHFSKKNIQYHNNWIKKDNTKEHKFSYLSRIYVIKK